MMCRRKAVCLFMGLGAMVCGGGRASAGLILSAPNDSVEVDFASFLGAGFSPAPATGQLNSRFWRVGGLSGGTLDYGDLATTGDFARGRSTGRITTGGIYAFEVSPGDFALGVQPGGSDFTPGFLELRVWNKTGATIPTWNVRYDLLFLNDQPRASSWNFSYSTDGLSFTSVPALDFNTPTIADSTSFVSASRMATVAATVPRDAYLYLRWDGDDFASTGRRDELALDNIYVAAMPRLSPVPEPSSLAVMGTLLLGWFGWRRLRWVLPKRQQARLQSRAARNQVPSLNGIAAKSD
ncbi:MAG: PEP-CTERM sorting domain-containing protein [Pirellulaceae bacterium]